MLDLYFFPHDSKTPYDHLADKETGIRPGWTAKPSGIIKHNLQKGTKGVVLPPLATWLAGKWFDELPIDKQDDLRPRVLISESREAYLVTGEGTPGNCNIRVYILPIEIARDKEPDHPAIWPERLQNGTATTFYNSYAENGWASRNQVTATPKPPVAAKPPAPPPLPHNIRIRCTGCGHWWKVDDLPKHANNCCPGKEETKTSDWAIICECCDTLDEVAECKPGFPRPVVKKKEEKKPVVKAKPVEVIDPEPAVA